MALVRFISKRMILNLFLRGSVIEISRLFIDTKNLFGYENFGKYIAAEFERIGNKVVTKNDLYEILKRYCNKEISNSSFMEEFGNSRLEEVFESLDELFARFLNNSKVVCFSRSHTNFLMWSHYASGHNGVCLEFEVDIDPENCNIGYLPMAIPAHMQLDNSIDPNKYQWKQKVRAVRYRKSLSKLDFYNFLPIFVNEGDIDLENLSKSYWHQFAHGIEDAFLQKLEPWSDEEEWRIVEVIFKAEMPEDNIWRFSEKSLTGIYFGAKTSKIVRNRVKNILDSTKCNPIFYQCKLDGTRGVRTELLQEGDEF